MTQGRFPGTSRFLRVTTFFALLQLAFISSSCGGSGGGEQQSPPPPMPDFGLGVNPPMVSISEGHSSPVSLSATALNGFGSQIFVQVSGLPAGVTASPASFNLTPGTPQTVILSATANAPATTVTAMWIGTAGSLTHIADLQTSVIAVTAGPLPTRTRYVRNDAVTEYYSSLNTHWEVYHSPTSHFFVTDPDSNHVFVFDSSTETQIASLSVPGAYAVDETPDQSTLYVGTLIGDIYTIDPLAIKVTQRYLASGIGPYGYQATVVLPLSDGRLALLGGQGGIPSVDGSANFAIWNPADNSITIYASSYGAGESSGLPVTTVCGPMENIGGFALTADRTEVIVGSIDSDSTLCEVNATTGVDNYVTSTAPFVFHIVRSPDGNYIALPNLPNQVALYDAHSLKIAVQFPVAGDIGSDSALVFSSDSKTLYVPSATFVYAYNTATGQLIGWLPNIVVEPANGGFAVGPITGPNYEFIDSTGLLCGPLEEGFGFLDTTTVRTGPVGTAFLNAYLTPATGPAIGGTQAQWSVPATVNSNSNVYFGSNPASLVSIDGGLMTATTPAGTPGPADVYLFATDGGMQLVPDGFSYGPSILEVTPGSSTADGGGTGVIYGYGFGSVDATTIPSDLRVTVGSTPAQLLGFNPGAYDLLSPPFLLQSVYYSIPAGSSGTSVDVSVTTGSGTGVAQGAFSYLPAPELFPLAGSVLAQGIYDPVRSIYYFTDAGRIQVFSLTQRQWLSPINIPAPIGPPQRLWGIALSPDGSKLAVADAQANVIFLVDPANTSTVKSFPFVPPSPLPQGIIDHPVGVAISDAGIVYITVFVEGGTGFSSFFKLDTNTGIITDYHLGGPQRYVNGVPQDLYLKAAISSDNSRVFFNADGSVFGIDTATDKVFHASADPNCCFGNYDLTLSQNQTQFEASSYLYDTNLNAESFLTLNDREVLSTSYVYGTKLSADGTLLFQPSSNGLDVFDGRLGTLLDRVAFSFALSANYDALVDDGKDNVLIAVTGTNGSGIAVVDLTSLSEPAALPYAAPHSVRSVTEIRPSALSADLQVAGQSSAKRDLAYSAPRAVPHITHSILSRAK
jgi:hypothetical protein